MSVVNITGGNFDELVLKSEKKVLLDFWATSCGPFRIIILRPAVIAEEYDSITVGKINVDEEMALATKFGITSIPTLIVMEKGQVVNTALGFRPKESILKLLEL